MQLIIVIVQLKKTQKKPTFSISCYYRNLLYYTKTVSTETENYLKKRVYHLCFKKLITCDLIILNRILIFKDVLKMYSISIQQ